jgi:hypothetical protein
MTEKVYEIPEQEEINLASPRGDWNKSNTFKVKETEITSAAVKVDFPEDAKYVYLYHNSANEVIWLGDTETITKAGEGTAPLWEQKMIPFNVNPGNNNNIFAITSSTTVTAFAIGMVNE